MISNATTLGFNDTKVEVGYGMVAAFLADKLRNASRHYHRPIIRETREQRFTSLRMQWEENVRFVSSISEISSDPNYQKIIGMGESVLPSIFRSMYTTPGNWFWALQSITGIDPIKDDHRGNMKLMTEDWLLWAKKNGYKIS